MQLVAVPDRIRDKYTLCDLHCESQRHHFRDWQPLSGTDPYPHGLPHALTDPKRVIQRQSAALWDPFANAVWHRLADADRHA